MYKRNAQGWSKHFDFIVIDEISLQLAFILAVMLRMQKLVYADTLYRTLGITLILVDAVVLVLNNSMHDVIKRGFYQETVSTIKHVFLVFAVSTIYTFATQKGDEFSRLVFALTFLIYLLLSYATRVLWKHVVKKLGSRRVKQNSMLVVVTPETAEDILTRLGGDELADFKITGVVLTRSTGADSICGYPIVTNIDHAADYIVREWVDSVYIDSPLDDPKVLKLMDDCAVMAVPTHYHVPNMSRNGTKRFSERKGGTTVLTTSINYATPVQILIKRTMDILAGIVGSLFALIVIAVVAPQIKKQSPGPILFKQTRIGKNGQRFDMLKIRTMDLDADSHKAELMDQNRVSDGMMFKLDWDPRIIGNKIVNGKQVTGIGQRIRDGSWDEWPQFFNILKSDMSLVGTRPPTVDEWEKYKYHHRARLSTKPGLTGMWQVSGRSKITDFEEVVKLDTEYINHWSIGLDIRILLKTVKAVFTKNGAM